MNLHDEVCFTTEIEAEEHGVELGKHWVNNRIQSMKGENHHQHLGEVPNRYALIMHPNIIARG